MLESLSSGNSCYFETDEEIKIFKQLALRYLAAYVHIHRLYVSSEGYHLLVEVKSQSVLRRNYTRRCNAKGKEINVLFYKETWRIVSEQIRILHSTFVKAANKCRDRKGVLVQKRYGRYYFESMEEFDGYIDCMDRGAEIQGQKNNRYRVRVSWKLGIRWGIFRCKEWVLGLCVVDFRDYVVSNLIKNTILLQTSQKSP